MNKYIDPAKYALELEIKGLQSLLEKSLDDNFIKLIKTIQKTKGKVVISGMGKSGYIAHKAAATLASTGTPAFFVHPSEASHGDMGMISKNDTVVLLSDSGGTRELKDIIAYCKRYNITLVGITRKSNSLLTEASDIKIVLERVPETNAVDAPTTSTTMMIAYIDALASTLIALKGFDQDRFKVYHPGGKLGASLVKVEEVMVTGKKIPLVDENASLNKILDEIIEKRLGCTGVLNKSQNLVGIITDGDLKRQLKKHKGELMKLKAKDIMTKDPVVIEKGSFAMEAVNLMSTGVGQDQHYIDTLFVVDSEADCEIDQCNAVGLIHIQNCFKKGVI